MLLVVGKTSTRYIEEGINEYCRRLTRYTPFLIKVIADIKKNSSLTKAQQKQKEGEQILATLSTSDYVMLLDEHGKQYTSVEFASMLQTKMASGLKRLVFVVGGPYGFSEEVYQRSDAMISLSKMTFSHEMIRLFFTEQVYRALTILRGEPYHHE